MPNEQDNATQEAEQPIIETSADVVSQEPVIEPAVEQPAIPVPVVEQPPAQTSETFPEPPPVVTPDPVEIETPAPEPIPETPITVEPEPITIPEQPVSETLPPAPEPTPPIAPTVPPMVSELMTTKQVQDISQEIPNEPDPEIQTVPPPIPQPTADPNNSGIPQKVLDLTPEELDAARRLWAIQNIKAVQAKSAKVRHQKREELLEKMVSYIKTHAPVTLSMIAYNLNISPRKASDCLRDLVQSGRIQATGHTTSHHYS